MNRFELTRKVAVLGICANISLLVIKLFAGFSSRSQAMTADGFNSAGDVFASFITYIGNRAASKPEDQTHPYGHGKAEYIYSMVISFSLLLAAYKIFNSSLRAILHGETFTFSPWLVITAAITILTKLFLFIYTGRAGRREDNLLILANSEDHRNDVFVTSSTLLGILLGRYGIFWLDGVVGTGISVWIAYTGVRIFRSSYKVLMDTNMDAGMKNEITEAAGSLEGVDHVDDVTAKPVGVNYIIIIKVSVHGGMTVNESHRIAARIREKVRGIKKVGDVIVHVNPA